MKDGVCPKCGGRDVYRGPGGSVATGWAARDAAVLPMTMMTGAALTNYVCAACGYVERYVDSPANRRTITETWGKVVSRDASEQPNNGSDEHG